MTFQLVHPDTLPPDVLDDLLAQGWYRMRQAVFTCRYLLGRRGLYTAVWTRLPLRGHVPGKAQRRRMRRIEERFRVEVRPWQLTDEHALLYRRYRQHVGGDRSDELEEVLHDDSARDIFDSMEVRISEPDGRIVAFSVFDRGRRSLQSIVGVYDPELGRFGLGIATMLFEVRYGADHGYEYHYAGYVVPGVESFEYKREAGALEFYDPRAAAWRPMDELEVDRLPATRLWSALQQVSDDLTAAGVPNTLRCYPPFRIVFMNGLQGRCLASPLFLECGPEPGADVCLAVTHDPDRGGYALEAYLRAEDLTDRLVDGMCPDDGPPAEPHLLVRMDRAGWTTDRGELVRWVRRAWRASARRGI